MRWHIQGTDAATNQVVALSIDESDATRTIKAAIDRQIVVDRIDRGSSSWRGSMVAAGGILLIAAAGLAVGLYVQNQKLHGELEQTLGEQTRLAATLSQAERMASEIGSQGTLADGDAARLKKIAEELSTARGKMSLTEQQLTAAHKQLDDLETAAARVPGLETQLAAAEKRAQDGETLAARQRQELQLQSRRMDDLQRLESLPQVAGTQPRDLEKINRALVAEVDKLKNELLFAVARGGSLPSESGGEALPAGGTGGMRWALKPSYETARQFLALHSDPNSIATEALETDAGASMSFGAQPENAYRVQVMHDRAETRVYEVTLTISLAAGAPKDKLAQNMKMIGQFLGTFSPGMKEADGVISGAISQLGGQDGNRRLVILAEEAKVTIWNNREGMFTFKVETGHGEE